MALGIWAYGRDDLCIMSIWASDHIPFMSIWALGIGIWAMGICNGIGHMGIWLG